MTSRPIILLGADRSGASLLASMLHVWGAWAGEPSRLTPADAPNGAWEYLPLQEHLAALQESAGTWEWSPDFRERLRELADVPAHRESAERLAAEMASRGTPWFWKDPLLCLYLPFWERIWADPLCLVLVRHPADAALSFEKSYLPKDLLGRAGLTAYYAFRWQHMMLTVLESAAADRPSTLFLAYEDLLRSPVEQCRRLCQHLDRHLGTDRLAEAFLPMIETIDPGLWRSKTGIPFDEVQSVTAAQKELFRLLQRRIRGEGAAEPFDRSRYPFSAFAQEYLENVSIFRALLDKEPSPGGIARERLRLRAVATAAA